jgi:hypothetical protein
MKKILITLALVATATLSYGQGYVKFENTTLQRFQLFDDATSTQQQIPTSESLNFGIFVGTSASSLSLTPVTPLAVMGTGAGLITVPGGSGQLYALTGTSPGQTPFLQIRGWSSSFGSDWAAAQVAYLAGVAGTRYGETDIRQIDALATSLGPGTVIWQGSTGTGATKFNPLVVHVAVPEPSTIALGVLLGVLGMAGLVFIRRRK